MANNRLRAAEQYPWKDGWRVMDCFISDPDSAPVSKRLNFSSTSEEDSAARLANKAIKKIIGSDEGEG